MQKNKLIWAAALTATAVAAGVTVYYMRKRKLNAEHAPRRKKGNHLTDVFAKAKSHAGGEYTL
jgi:hypothetical protein